MKQNLEKQKDILLARCPPAFEIEVVETEFQGFMCLS